MAPSEAMPTSGKAVQALLGAGVGAAAGAWVREPAGGAVPPFVNELIRRPVLWRSRASIMAGASADPATGFDSCFVVR